MSNDICESINGILGVYIAIKGIKAGIKTEIEIVIVVTISGCLAITSISRSI
jgi:hypothetical protein